MHERAVAIVGMACRYPDAPHPQQLWKNIVERKVSFRPYGERWDHSLFLASGRGNARTTPNRMVAWIDGVDQFAARHFRIPPRRAEYMDPQQRLTLEVVREALADAGLERRPFSHERSAIFVGASVSEYSRIMVTATRTRQMRAGEYGVAYADAEELTRRITPSGIYSMAGSLLSMCATEVAQTFDLRGPAMALDAACASSLVAVTLGVNYLRSLPPRSQPEQPAPLVVAGGVYLNLLPDNALAFARTGALANDSCRPFDAAAEGFLIGEGAAVVVLKRLADAVADGDRIYATVRGVGWCGDGPADSPMTPVLHGQETAMRYALEDCDMDPASIGYVECHGTATPIGDALELKALENVLGAAGCRACIGSTKANFGHALTAAGVAGLMRAALAIYFKTLPPQAGWDCWHPKLESASRIFRIATEAEAWSATPRRAMVNAFGFGGINSVVTVEEAPSRPAVNPGSGPYLFCASAPTPPLLDGYLRTLACSLEPGVDLAAVSYTLTATRALGAYAAAFVAHSAQQATDRMAELLAALQEAPSHVQRVGRGGLLGPVTRPTDPPDPGATLVLDQNSADAAETLLALAAKQMRGEEVVWSQVFGEDARRITDVPISPLVRERFWIVKPA